MKLAVLDTQDAGPWETPYRIADGDGLSTQAQRKSRRRRGEAARRKGA